MHTNLRILISYSVQLPMLLQCAQLIVITNLQCCCVLQLYVPLHKIFCPIYLVSICPIPSNQHLLGLMISHDTNLKHKTVHHSPCMLTSWQAGRLMRINETLIDYTMSCIHNMQVSSVIQLADHSFHPLPGLLWWLSSGSAVHY